MLAHHGCVRLLSYCLHTYAQMLGLVLHILTCEIVVNIVLLCHQPIGNWCGVWMFLKERTCRVMICLELDEQID